MSNQQNREPWIDWIRVAASIGIIALHVTAREKVRRADSLAGLEWWTLAGYEVLTRIAVPLFFMISGYLVIQRCENGNSATYAWSRAGRIVALACFWTLIFSVWEILKGNNDSLLNFPLNALKGQPYYHLWFLFAIAGSYAVSPIVAPGLASLKPKFRGIVGWGIPLAFAADYLVSQTLTSASFYRTSVFAIFIPYLSYTFAGYLLQSKTRSFSLAAYLVGAILCIVAFSQLTVWKIPDADRLVYSPLSPGVVVMSLGAYGMLFSLRDRFPPLPSLASRFARDSMGIYILHPFALDVVNHLGLYGRRPNALVGIAFTTLLVTATTWVCVVCMKRFSLTRLTVAT